MDAPSQRENFNHPGTICRTYGAGRNTLSILRINPPKFGGGLKFEPDPRGIGYAFHGAGAGIGKKGAFCKGLSYQYPQTDTKLAEFNNRYLLRVAGRFDILY
jgi:hypothetical protein